MLNFEYENKSKEGSRNVFFKWQGREKFHVTPMEVLDTLR